MPPRNRSKECTPFLGARHEHSVWGCKGAWSLGRGREAWTPRRGSGVPEPPSPPRFWFRRNGKWTAYPLPKRLGESRRGKTPPFPEISPGPSRVPRARLTRLPVDLDVKVALRPVLRPHRYRGGGKSWEREGGKRSGPDRSGAGAGAEPEARSPRASLSRPCERVRRAPSRPRPPGSHTARTPKRAGASPGWPPA